jgi:serine/threonine-protein kinase RsbW
LNLRVRVTLAADRKAVDPVVAQVMEAVRSMKCVDGKEDAIELALQEALANAVVHGAKEDPSKIVECLVACDEQRGILIIVRDPGPGFDPNAIPSCTIGENLFSNHGRGIFLINQLMDEVKFHESGTEIHGKRGRSSRQDSIITVSPVKCFCAGSLAPARSRSGDSLGWPRRE